MAAALEDRLRSLGCPERAAAEAGITFGMPEDQVSLESRILEEYAGLIESLRPCTVGNLGDLPGLPYPRPKLLPPGDAPAELLAAADEFHGGSPRPTTDAARRLVLDFARLYFMVEIVGPGGHVGALHLGGNILLSTDSGNVVISLPGETPDAAVGFGLNQESGTRHVCDAIARHTGGTGRHSLLLVGVSSRSAAHLSIPPEVTRVTLMSLGDDNADRLGYSCVRGDILEAEPADYGMVVAEHLCVRSNWERLGDHVRACAAQLAEGGLLAMPSFGFPPMHYDFVRREDCYSLAEKFDGLGKPGADWLGALSDIHHFMVDEDGHYGEATGKMRAAEARLAATRK